jgi:phenylacetate-coenzyme A ligase PaaK-like adenylate-forming protein
MPQHLLALARAPEAARLAAPGLESVLLCSDVAVPEARRAIAHGLDCRVHTHYGSTESGLGGAVECVEGAGCHIRENDLLFEVVAPDTGRPLPEGETGELVLTTLTRRGMPLLRYRTGDLGALEATRCPCGSVLARLRDLRGRLRDTLRLAGGESLSLADLDSALLALPGLRAYEAGLRLAETEPGGQTTEILHVALLPATPDASGLEEAAGRALPALPAIERATAAGRLSVETALTGLDPGQSHTVKRHLRDQR